jgi:RNA-binding protein YlmH
LRFIVTVNVKFDFSGVMLHAERAWLTIFPDTTVES